MSDTNGPRVRLLRDAAGRDLNLGTCLILNGFDSSSTFSNNETDISVRNVHLHECVTHRQCLLHFSIFRPRGRPTTSGTNSILDHAFNHLPTLVNRALRICLQCDDSMSLSRDKFTFFLDLHFATASSLDASNRFSSSANQKSYNPIRNIHSIFNHITSTNSRVDRIIGDQLSHSGWSVGRVAGVLVSDGCQCHGIICIRFFVDFVRIHSFHRCLFSSCQDIINRCFSRCDSRIRSTNEDMQGFFRHARKSGFVG
mmetsp:Transcript_48401/g.139203  ORF Transcript_48401/g.139203 Transcript_48401/m.139203 type:complete len:255 (+) Transcript_48401:2934-3698(+)